MLAAALQRHYGLAAIAVRFIPAGETAWCYQATDEHGGRWFLRLGRPGAIEGARAEFTLQLCDVLAGLGCRCPGRGRPRPGSCGAGWMGCGWRCSSSLTASRSATRTCASQGW